MSGGREVPSEIWALLDGLVNGTLTPDQHARLGELLAASAEARTLYFDYLDLHLGLRQTALAGQTARPLAHLQERLAARRRPRRLGIAVGFAVAAAAAIVLVARRPSKPESVASLASSAAARFVGVGSSLKLGDPLTSGREYALREGRAELRFKNGVEVIVEGPAAFVVHDQMRMTMKMGKAAVHITPGAEGFLVDTPVARVVDRGTRFAIDVNELGETEVQVVEGAAEVSASGGAAPVELKRGAAQRYAFDGTLNATAVAYDESRFPLVMPDRVVSYTVTQRGDTGGAEDLTSITVRRGSQVNIYPVERLIGIELIHFKSVIAGRRNHFTSTVTGGADPRGERHALIDSDRNLNTGVINPGGSPTPLDSDPVMSDPEDPARPNTPGMAFRFRKAVRNDAGPDVVLFDFQPIIQPEYGDPFHVSPLHFAPGLHSHTVRRFDMGVFSPEALTIAGFRLNTFAVSASSLGELERVPLNTANDFTVTSKALAVGIDLSVLGYAPGALVEGLFIQDVLDNTNMVDPVFIAGLPPLD